MADVRLGVATMVTDGLIERAAGTEHAAVGGGARPDELIGRVNELAAELAGLAGAATSVTPDLADAMDGVRIDRLRALEVLKSAVCAVQACVSAEFAGSQRARQVKAGVAPARAGRGIPAQIGLARRESPYKAQQLLGLATCLVGEMPYTLAALARGELNEWRATLIARETAVLSREHRAAVDRELCGPGGTAATLGDAGIVRASRAIGQRLDPGAAWARAQKSERERRVTIRPAPDCMARITALLPVVQGVGVYAALSAAADTAIATGQATAGPDDAPAGRQALMADELVARVLGFSVTQPANPDHPASPASPDRSDRSDRPFDPFDPADPVGLASPDRPANSGRPADSAAAGRPAEPSDAGNPASPGGSAEPSAAGSPAGSAWYRGPVPRRMVPEPAVEVQLIMTDWTLLGLDNEPAHLTGYGPIPAPLARRIASGQPGYGGTHPDPGAADAALRWIRRLYQEPGSQPGPQEPGPQEPGPQEPGGGQDRRLIGMDSQRRLFPAAVRRFMIARDQFCRTPFCGALIRHIDHIHPATDGGPTTVSNGQGLCEACNYAKQAPGWQQTSDDDSRSGGEVVTITPTGHQYTSSPPPPPGSHGGSVGSGNPAEHGVAA